MKYVKVLGLAAVIAAALMAFAGSASATILTGTGCSAETGCAAGTVIKAELKAGTKATLTSSFIGEVICEKSTVEGKTSNAGGASETVNGGIEALSFTSCNGTVTVLKNGTLEIHTENTTSNGNGTLTSNGAEVTVEIVGLHCIYSTSNTDVGKVTGSVNTGGTATMTAASAAIKRTAGRSGAFCGESATWNASYVVNTPDSLSID